MASEVPEFFRGVEKLCEAMAPHGWIDRVYLNDNGHLQVTFTDRGEKQLRAVWGALGPFLPELLRNGQAITFFQWLELEARNRGLSGADKP